jgi:hypothetical protein
LPPVGSSVDHGMGSQGLGFRVQGSGFSGQGSGLWGEGSFVIDQGSVVRNQNQNQGIKDLEGAGHGVGFRVTLIKLR